MAIIEIHGDSSPGGILKHWERKTKQECAREILRSWSEIEQLRARIAELEADKEKLQARNDALIELANHIDKLYRDQLESAEALRHAIDAAREEK